MKFLYSSNQLKCAVRFIYKNNEKIHFEEQYLEEKVYGWMRNIADIIRDENPDTYIYRNYGFVIWAHRKSLLNNEIVYEFQILVEPNIKVGGAYKYL